MKITRFVNGRKFNQEFSKEIVIDNDIIRGAIEKINAKLRKKENKVKHNG